MADFTTLLDPLTQHDVGFVVIGALAAVAHGSAHVTNDLDLCFDIIAGAERGRSRCGLYPGTVLIGS